METILVLAHPEADGALSRHAREVLTAAQTLAAALPGSTLQVGLIGADPAAAVSGLSGLAASRLLVCAAPELAQARYSTDAAAAEAVCRAAGATLVLAPTSFRWNRVLSGVAQRLGGRVDTHATALQAAGEQPQVTRWYYRQRLEAQLSRTTRPWVVSLESGCAAAWTSPGGAAPAAETVALALTAAHRRTEVTGLRAPPADEQTIRPDAALLFVAGAGWTKAQADGKAHADDAERIILEFLRRTQASLGSTKSLVDLSGEGQQVLRFMTHLNQVGQTGSTPRHPKGLATCCHGEEPHTVGWRFIGERRAVNTNAACSWAQGKADVLYVADAFEVMRRVNALLAARAP